MYTYFLSLKYLLSRPINLLGILGVAVAVWALIVVISVFSGFIRDVRIQIRGAEADVTMVVGEVGQSFEKVASLLRQHDEVIAVAPRIVWNGLIYAAANRRHCPAFGSQGILRAA